MALWNDGKSGFMDMMPSGAAELVPALLFAIAQLLACCFALLGVQTLWIALFAAPG